MKKPKLKGKVELQPMAKLIQTAMQQKGMDAAALTEAMGLETGQRGVVYNWVAGKNGPGGHLRPRLAKVLELTEDQLTATGTRSPRKLGPAQRAVALIKVAKVNGELVPPPPVVDVFQIRARSDGTMQVRLDVGLPFAKGVQLVQFLLGFGLVIGAETEG